MFDEKRVVFLMFDKNRCLGDCRCNLVDLIREKSKQGAWHAKSPSMETWHWKSPSTETWHGEKSKQVAWHAESPSRELGTRESSNWDVRQCGKSW